MTRARASWLGDWRITFALAWVVLCSLSLVMAIDLGGVGIRPLELVVRVGHICLCVVVVVMLWVRRNDPTGPLCVAALAMLFVPLFPSLWLSEQTLALAGHEGVPWQPFFGHKVAAVGLAILAPRPVWFTPAIHAGLLLHGTALWFALDLGEPAATIPSQEPWESLTYLAISTVVYWVGVHHRNALMKARAEAATHEATNQAFLAVRDLANTPLQNLELAISLLELRQAAPDQNIERARRAVRRLAHLNEVLRVDEAQAASLDPETLRRHQSGKAQG